MASNMKPQKLYLLSNTACGSVGNRPGAQETFLHNTWMQGFNGLHNGPLRFWSYENLSDWQHMVLSYEHTRKAQGWLQSFLLGNKKPNPVFFRNARLITNNLATIGQRSRPFTIRIGGNPALRANHYIDHLLRYQATFCLDTRFALRKELMQANENHGYLSIPLFMKLMPTPSIDTVLIYFESSSEIDRFINASGNVYYIFDIAMRSGNVRESVAFIFDFAPSIRPRQPDQLKKLLNRTRSDFE